MCTWWGTIPPRRGIFCREQFRGEYGELAAAVAYVDGVEAAVDHIHAHGRHTDCIVTENEAVAKRFSGDACVFTTRAPACRWLRRLR